jgi:cytoskeletal protein CcmA (bactofilin family)
MSLWEQDQDANHSTTLTTSQQTAAPSPSRSEMTRSGKPATIGQSVEIKGELSGQEDLVIDGSIEGKIFVHDHRLTIGPNGQIHAEVHANSVQIDGAVVGNITAGDRVEISSSGSVLGDIMAPRVALAEGARFKGSIDMGRRDAPSTQSSTASVDRDVLQAASEV